MTTINSISFRHAAIIVIAAVASAACETDSEAELAETDRLTPSETAFGTANDAFAANEWYPGGELGTTLNPSYSDPAPAVTQTAGMEEHFNKGEDFFEHIYTIEQQPRKGLGPAWVRNSCISCHPGYGHGKRTDSYKANQFGNGYLLVVYHPTDGVDADGVAYTANSYIRHVTGMPQTKAMHPFKAPIDESQIRIEWKSVETMPSGLPMAFADGETYSLIYPEVSIPQSAFNTVPKPDNYDVRLESTIGIYGTGLLDAIDQEDMKEQYRKEAAAGATLNPAIWNSDANDWAASAWYTLSDGTKQVKKFTYAMTRASLQDGPGANAIWNITNVSRSDRHYLYSTKQWAKAMAADNDVLQYIKDNGGQPSSILHPYYADGSTEGIAQRVESILGCNTAAEKSVFEKYLLEGMPYNGEEEMTDRDYYDFMVWHRGLAVPAARNLDREDVKKGKKLFTQIGCASCHRPSWTTREDNYWADSSLKAYAKANNADAADILPKFPGQTIYPYTDLVQHRLFMANDIRTGWCRTTPLWGRGLSLMLTGADDRLHDCRARNVVEAIMWHGYSKQSDAYYTTEKFYNLPKSDRDAIVAFINAI